MIDLARIHAAAPSPLALALRLGLTPARGSREDRAVVPCVWHSPDRHPSCVIAVRGGRIVAYCHSCRQGGDLLSLVAAARGLDVRAHFGAVVAAAADLLGVGGGAAAPTARPPARNRIAALARRIDLAADHYLTGRAVHDDEVIDRAPETERAEAFELLRALDEIQEVRDTELERLADRYWARGRA